MGFEYLNDDLDIVQKLSNRPSETEPDELTPAEFKAKFDEAANIIKNYINERLLPSITASSVPFASQSGNVQGDTVAAAIEWLKNQMAQTQLGQIGDGTITAEKLNAEVQQILNSGIPVVSTEAPSGNYPVGQIWLKTDVDGAMETMYIKVSATVWVAYTFSVLPISRGGTGYACFETGSMLYGNNGELKQLPAPAENSFLHFGAKPEWKNNHETKQQLGFLTVATGTYVGNGEEREIVLVPNGDGTETEDNENAISPVFICVHNKDEDIVNDTYKMETSVCICNGARAHTVRDQRQRNHICVVALSGSKLLFRNEIPSSSSSDLERSETTFMNYKNNTYYWTALY